MPQLNRTNKRWNKSQLEISQALTDFNDPQIVATVEGLMDHLDELEDEIDKLKAEIEILKARVTVAGG